MNRPTEQEMALFTRIFMSVLVMTVALFIILSNLYPDSHLKWAFGVIGIILGYWFK
jgi:uncharacterized membrane protein